MKPKHFNRDEVEEIFKTKGISIHDFLHSFLDQGFLLHGSEYPNIQEFQPHIPGDPSGGWSSQFGVYASSIKTQIIFAIIHREKVFGNYYMESAQDQDGKPFYAVSEEVKKSNAIQPGYVYILPLDGFEENPGRQGEWRSQHPVKPVGSVPVLPSDLGYPIRTVIWPDYPFDVATHQFEYKD